MDEIVLRAMAKWPDVPAVYGWLSLDRRGDWRIKGERIANAMVRAFIGRNYAQDAAGCWFFQNGPQRVFVSLDYTPFVYRVINIQETALGVECHTGAPVAALRGAWIDEHGALLLESEYGVGIVLDRDLERVFPCLVDAGGNRLDEGVLEPYMEMLTQAQQAPLWIRYGDQAIEVAPIRSVDVPGRFRYVKAPEAPAGEETCR